MRAIITGLKKTETSDSIIDHDAYNLVLVQRLRTKYVGTPLFSGVWLTTIDNKLPRADTRLRALYPNPHCQMIERWGTILLPFQNAGTFMPTDDYISYLASQELGAIPEETLDIHIFEALEKAEVDLGDMLAADPEIVFRALSDLQADREAQAMLSQVDTASENEAEEVKKQFREKMLAVLSQSLHKQGEAYQDEIDRLRRGVEELSEELSSLKSAKEMDAAKVELFEEKLKETKKALRRYERMPLWERVKYLIRGK